MKAPPHPKAVASQLRPGDRVVDGKARIGVVTHLGLRGAYVLVLFDNTKWRRAVHVSRVTKLPTIEAAP